MAQQINDTFQLLAGLPIEDRIVKPTIAERDAIPSTRRFQGLQCFVQQTQTLYLLIGGIANSNWKGIAGSNSASELETVIEGFYVLSAGKTTLLDWEVGDKFRGWIGSRYVVGEILTLPVSLPSDIDDISKVRLVVDSSAVPIEYANVVYVNNNDPNSATIFDVDNPPLTNDNALKEDVDNLYVGLDSSTWVYSTDSLTYETEPVISDDSNFYLAGTTIDAGNTKTAPIERLATPGVFAFRIKSTLTPDSGVTMLQGIGFGAVFLQGSINLGYALLGYMVNALSSLGMLSQVAQNADTGDVPLNIIQGNRLNNAGNTASAVVNRPILGINNYLTRLLTIFANGEIEINNLSGTGDRIVSTTSTGKLKIITDSIFGTFINGLTAKTTPIDADSISIVDSADSNKQKKVSLTNFKAYLKAYFDGIYLIPQITITTAVSITTATNDASGNGQKGRNVVIDNGANAINLTVNGGTDFVSSYVKHGSSAITFVQGSGRTLIQVDGTAILNGAVGSTATISSIGTTDYLRISNA